jgi:hypothetical protein
MRVCVGSTRNRQARVASTVSIGVDRDPTRREFPERIQAVAAGFGAC